MRTTLTPPIHTNYCHPQRIHLFFIFMLCSFLSWSQQSNLACNSFTPWVDNATFTVFETHNSSGAACWDEDNLLCEFGNGAPENAENANLTDFARGNITALGSLTLRITDTGGNEYDAGNFAGFRMANSGLNLGVLSSTTIRTYLDNGLQQTVSGGDLLAVGLNLGGNIFDIGFVTTMPFDAIEISVSALVGIGFFDVYYAIIADFCPGPELDCNIQTAMNLPVYPMTIDYLNTGTTGVGIGTVNDPEDAISASTTDFAELTTVANIAGTMFISIEEQITEYPAGTFAGFDIENLTVLGVDLLNNIVISTYLDNDFQESVGGSNLLLGAPLLSSDGRHVVGFVTTLPFNEVRFTLTQPLNVQLGTTLVYSAIFREFCNGDPLPCNTLNAPSLPEYPLFIDDQNTGITGGVCAGCSVNNSDRVIDENLDNYATIVLTAAVLNVGRLSVKDQLNTYPAGTFAGFRIENPVLLDANVLEAVTITLYNNDQFVESQTNVGTLVSVGTGLLANLGEHIIGFVSSADFDEVQISLVNTADVNLGTTRIYNLIIEPFCAAEIECNTTYYLTNPDYPVYIDALLTGVDGVACVGCEVEGEQNLLTASNTDFATITIAVNALGSASIAVRDALYEYPAGTFAGFVIEDPGFLIEAELFESLTISTFNDGDFVESRTGSDLIDLGVLILFISADQGRYNVGFQTTQAFDEIRITTGSLATAINLVRVYAAFVDTRSSNGGELACIDGPIAMDDEATTDEETPVVIDVLENDETDMGPLNDPTLVDPPSHGEAEVDEDDGTFLYTPDSNFVGLDTFTYSVCDASEPTVCDEAMVIVTVEPVKDTIYQSLPNDSTFMACANDLTTYNSPATTIMVCNPPPGGSANVTGSCVTYTPDPGFVGDDVLCVVSCHPTIPNLCDTTIILIEVTASSPPDAVQDEAETDEEVPVNIEVLANDSDPDSPLGFPTITEQPSNGGVVVELDGTITYTPDSNFVGLDTFEYKICDNSIPPLCDSALVIILVNPVIDTIRDTIPGDSMITLCAGELTTFTEAATEIEVCGGPFHGTLSEEDDCLTYTPATNFSGLDTICLIVCHPDSTDLCDTTIVIINVTPVNDPPDAVDDEAETDEEVSVNIDVLDNDSDPDSPLGFPMISDPPSNGGVVVELDGTITYTPDSNFVGLDTFEYIICDNGTPPLCDSALVIILVNPVQDTIRDTIPGDSTVTLCAGDLTTFTEAATEIEVCDGPFHGVLSEDGDCLIYEPAPNFSGLDTFCLVVCHPDSADLCDTTIVIITVTPVNDPPDAVDDEASTEENNPVAIDVLDNDSDPDSPLGLPSIVSNPENGTVMVNNTDSTIIYTPFPDFVGTDTFSYAICDDEVPPLCDTALVIITVFPARDTVIEVLPPDSLGEWCANELVDLPGVVDTIIICNMPDSGIVTLTDSCVLYTPDPEFISGSDTLCVIICDASICDTAVIIVQIECPAINIKVFLEGPYDSGTMTMSTTLNHYHVLPGQDPDESSDQGSQLLGVAAPAGQPYSSLPWNWQGDEGDDYGDGPNDREYPATVTDWLLVSIRANDSLPSSEIWKCAGLLHNNGVVEFPSACDCANIIDGEVYHVVVEHRNHLPIMSPALVAADNELDYDFTTNQSYVFFFGEGQKQIGTKYAMYAGNSEQISARIDINSSDDSVWLDENGTIYQYKLGDHNMDGDVNATDNFIWIINNGTFTLLAF